MRNVIHPSFQHGNNFKIGHFCIIEEDVIVGSDVQLGHNIVLKTGTRIMSNVNISDYVKTTGLCIIGNGVDIRTGACISRGVVINDNAFVGPGVMTNHTKNIMHMRNIPEVQLITNIGYGAVIGSMVSLLAGVTIADNVMIAAETNVFKDILQPGVYGRSPLEKIKDVDPAFILHRPADYTAYEFRTELLVNYLPRWIGFTT